VSKLTQWKQHYGITQEAFNALSDVLGLNVSLDDTVTPVIQSGKSEAAVQTECRLKASSSGDRLWRNNVGVAQRMDGVPVRYGLCNESKKMNSMIKSSDLIGIKRAFITPEMVGTFIGQFMAIEVKKADWKYTGTDREKAQLAFHTIVNNTGGYAKFINNVENM